MKRRKIDSTRTPKELAEPDETTEVVVAEPAG